MGRRMAAVGSAGLAAIAVNFFGVVYFFRPIAEADSVAGPPVPPAVGFLVYVLLSVAVLDRAAQRFGRPLAAGWVIAAAQVILLVDLVLSGERGVATGAAGSVLILLTWTAMAFVYSKVVPGPGPSMDVDDGADGA